MPRINHPKSVPAAQSVDDAKPSNVAGPPKDAHVAVPSNDANVAGLPNDANVAGLPNDAKDLNDTTSAEGTAADAATAQRALALLADRWTFLLVREAYRGVHRFGELQRNLGIARNVLADRLSKLVEQGLLERVRYRRNPDWYEYRLTQRGLDLYPTIIAFFHWVDTHYGDPQRPAVRLRHRNCGKLTQPQLVCSACSAPLAPQDVEILE
ncbi:MAG TPA: helix-turn-helix domain-containing protein [Solirubrobacteraceae bacterium]